MKYGGSLYYQNQDKKAWLGPVKVHAVKGREIFVFANGSVKKVPRCNIQLCEAEDDDNDEEKEEESKENKKKENSVSFEDKPNELETEEEKRIVTRSMTELERK